MIKHCDQTQHGKGKVSLGYISDHGPSPGGGEGWRLRQGPGSRGHGGNAASWFAPVACSACFLFISFVFRLTQDPLLRGLSYFNYQARKCS